MESKEVRVRYAPSPTGMQHIGGVRTALFNYENTGRKKEAVKNIRKSETVVSLPTCACSDAS